MTLRPHRPYHERERGAAASLLVVTGILIGLAIVAIMVIPLAVATDAKSRNRTAADAAALAGAEAIAGDLETVIGSGTWQGDWDDLRNLTDSGKTAALDYVHRNDSDSRLVYYRSRMDGLTWVVETEVESGPINDEGQRARSYARAEVGLPDCSFDKEDQDPPPTTPPPPPEDGEEGDDGEETEEPPPPPPLLKITCDGQTWTVDPTGDPEDPVYDLPGGLISTLLDGLKPRLVA